MLRLALLVCLLAPPASACTTFLLEQGDAKLLGKSYDWGHGQGMVLVNKRGVAKKSLVIIPGDKPAEWTSKYASVTFNQYGREMPNGGMNTAGLVVEIMWLTGSEYPPQDARPALTELQWIQYQLDRFSTVAQIVEHAPRLRVSRVYAQVHYLACDKSGACAAIEYLNGKLAITAGDALVAKALTNNTYAQSADYLKGHSTGAKGRSSLARFSRAATLPGKCEKADTAAAFGVLDQVRQGDYTKWNIVYDPLKLTVAWRTLADKQVKRVDLKRFDPSCAKPVPMLDMNTKTAGDVTSRFTDYTQAANRKLIDATTGDIAKHLPPGALWLLAGYPNLTTCKLP